MPRTKLSIDDLSIEELKRLGLRRPRKQNFSKDSTRSWALKVLALMAELTQDQRRRVLEHALKVNRM